MDDVAERALEALEKYGGWYGVLRALAAAEINRAKRLKVLAIGASAYAVIAGCLVMTKASTELVALCLTAAAIAWAAFMLDDPPSAAPCE